MPSKNKLARNNETRTPGCLKTTSTKHPEKGVKCPRCDSQNTKFCYYNNYSLTQPRYFCKGCRRYWTKGGALRTIPFGGGYRRRKIMKPSSSNIVMMATDQPTNELDLFRCFNVDFHLATPTTSTTSVLSNSSIGHQEQNFTLSSIESMSSINQDLYWKLQQQRLAMLFGGQNNNTNNTQKQDTHFISYLPLQNTTQYNNDDVANYYSRNEGDNGNLVTEWLLDSSYATVEPVAVNNCCSNRGISEGTSTWFNEMHGWSDFNQYELIMP